MPISEASILDCVKRGRVQDLGDVGGRGRNRPLDEQAMAAVVDPSLHRQRRESLAEAG